MTQQPCTVIPIHFNKALSCWRAYCLILPYGSNSVFGLHLATKLKIHGSVEPSLFPVVWLVSWGRRERKENGCLQIRILSLCLWIYVYYCRCVISLTCKPCCNFKVENVLLRIRNSKGKWKHLQWESQGAEESCCRFVKYPRLSPWMLSITLSNLWTSRCCWTTAFPLLDVLAWTAGRCCSSISGGV